MTLFWIAMLGSIGVLSRYGLDGWFARQFPAFPYGTLFINVLGSALAGLVFAFSAQGRLTPAATSMWLVGFCGGFTTFSAYSVQTVSLLEKGQVAGAMAYFLLGPTLGLAAAFLAYSMVKGLA